MIVAMAKEAETIPRVLEIRKRVNLTRLVSGLYRAGYVFVEIIDATQPEDKETESTEERTETE